MRLRFRNLLILFPLLITWIVFQLILYTRPISKSSRNRTRNFVFIRSTSFYEHRLKFIHKNYARMAQIKSERKRLDSSPVYEEDAYGPYTSTEQTRDHKSEKLWFMENGVLRPEKTNFSVDQSLWPEQSNSDRIIEQLMFLPRSHCNKMTNVSSLAMPDVRYNCQSKNRKILLIGDFDRNKLVSGKNIFRKQMCPVNSCTLASSLEEARNNDAVVFNGYFLNGIENFVRRRPENVWILYLLESPLNLHVRGIPKDTINWTASYRHDSDIVTPYGKFVPYREISKYVPEGIKLNKKTMNYAAHKRKMVAWFVSNCNAKNDRLLYAQSLSKHIEVDIYGQCGTKQCPRETHTECLEMVERDYKFYLSFENSNCKEYITEKFFENGLRRNILPIVMGPPREDYEAVAPPHSFIHINDFENPKDLADYLHILDANNTLYNEYFEWKDTGEFIDTRFWCRLCAMLHAPRSHKSYEDLQQWWSGPGVCQSY